VLLSNGQITSPCHPGQRGNLTFQKKHPAPRASEFVLKRKDCQSILMFAMDERIKHIIACCFMTGCLLAFWGCASPVEYSSQPLQRYDKNTSYRIDDQEDGFVITVNYSRYQFIPESDAVAMAGRSALMSIAYEVSDKRKRPIDQINEQRIKMSMGRNGLSGVTTWSGSVRVLYKK
jgi:hypothetical protein